jgi:hypothetical protein
VPGPVTVKSALGRLMLPTWTAATAGTPFTARSPNR